ncbi:MAG: BACON domain-containing protein [Candidatus Cryptobacteroides sp.]
MKKETLLIVIILLASFICGSCGKELTDTESGISAITPIPQEALNGNGESITLIFEFQEDWVAEVVETKSAGWLSVSPESGPAGRASINITASANEGNEARAAAVTFRSKSFRKEIRIAQEASGSQFSIDRSMVSIDSNQAGEFYLYVTATESWTASCDSDWLELSDKKGEESKSVRVQYGANPGSDREGILVFRCGDVTKTVKVWQIGGEVIDYVLVLNPNRKEMPADGGLFSFELTCDVNWKIENLPNWVSTAMKEGPGSTYPLTVYVTCEANEGAKRSASFKVSTYNGSKYEYFYIEQAAKEDNPSGDGGSDGILKGHKLNGTKWNVTWTCTTIVTGTASGKNEDGSYSYPINEKTTETLVSTFLFDGDYMHTWTKIEGEEVYEKAKLESREWTDEEGHTKITVQLPDNNTLKLKSLFDWNDAGGDVLVNKGNSEETNTISLEGNQLVVDGYYVENSEYHSRYTYTQSGKTITMEYKSTEKVETTTKGIGERI